MGYPTSGIESKFYYIFTLKGFNTRTAKRIFSSHFDVQKVIKIIQLIGPSRKLMN